MLVNISRIKFLINKSRSPEKITKPDKVVNCNHCGGAFRNSEDVASCIMCSRELGHICKNCTHTTAVTVEDNKKSA